MPPSTPHYLRFVRTLASVAAAGLAATTAAGCASSVGPSSSADGATADTVLPIDVAAADAPSTPAADATTTTADAEVCPPLSMTCPATMPPNSTCRFGGDSMSGCACLPGLSCPYPDTPPGTCGPVTCDCVVEGDAGVGHWSCCSPCVGPLPPPQLVAV